MLFKRLAAGIPALALAAGIGAAVLPAATAAEGAPPPLNFTLSETYCQDGKAVDSALTLSPEDSNPNYRFRAIQGDRSRFLSKSLVTQVFSNGSTSFSLLTHFGFTYGEPLTVEVYLFDKAKAYDASLYVNVENKDRFILVGAPQTITPVDPASLDCAPSVPEPSDETSDNQGEAGQGHDDSATGESQGSTGESQGSNGTSESPDSSSQGQPANPSSPSNGTEGESSGGSTEGTPNDSGSADNSAPQSEAPQLKGADQLPAVPAFELAAARCEANKATDNVMTVTSEKMDNYRFVATQDGRSLGMGSKLTPILWEKGKLTDKDITGAYPNFSFDYSKPISVQAYWFDRAKEFDPGLYDSQLSLVAGKSDRYIKLGEAKTLTLVNKDSLDCEPKKPEVTIGGVAPSADTKPAFVAGTSVKTPITIKGFTPMAKVDIYIHSEPVFIGTFTANEKGEVKFDLTVPAAVTAGDHTLVMTEQGSSKAAVSLPVTVAKALTEKPVAPDFTLSAATCEGTSKVDNVMTVNPAQKNDLLRFVATYNGMKVSLKSSLREKIWSNGQITAADIKAAYPSLSFDYTKPLSVQAYWFDQKGAYSPDLYDTSVGKDRFIALGEAKTITLVDTDSLDCDPKQPEVTIGGIKPSAEATPSFIAGTAVTTPITIKGFAPRAQVKVEIHSDPVTVGTFTADDEGTVAFDLRVPAAVAAGDHKLVITEEGSTKPSLEVPITVTAALTEKPAAPTFTLAAAKCEGATKLDNVMTIDPAQKNDLLRFVATYNGLKFSLKTELRQKLWETGKLTARDIEKSYAEGKFTFDYSKPLSVQAYWFDQKGLYAADLYDATVGKDRFIALGEAKSITFVDPASLTCTETAPIIPEPTKPEIAIGAASGSDTIPSLVADGKTATPVTAKGFAPESEVRVEIHSDPVHIGTFTADKSGVVKFDLLVPASVPAGAHKLVLTEIASQKSVSADIIVKAVEKSENTDPKKDDNTGGNKQPETKTPEKKDAGKPSETIVPETKTSKQNTKSTDTTTSATPALAKTGFESTLVFLAGFLTLTVGAAAMTTSRRRMGR